MAPTIPIMPFLRPLGPPRASTMRQFLRFSTISQRSARLQEKPSREDRNLIASRTAHASYPPPTMKSPPRPKESRASRRTAHPPKQRIYPTRAPSHSQPVRRRLTAEPVEPLPPQQCAPHLPYYVTRTPSKELPVYVDTKRGGNLLLTRVKKIDGNIETLRNELKAMLKLDKKECVINPVTKHIVLKGLYKPEVERFLRQRLF